MSETVNYYRVWCTGAGGRYEYEWNTNEPIVCPSDSTPIDSSLTTVVKSVSSSVVEIDNLPETAFGELSATGITPVIQMLFSYNNSEQTVSVTTTGSGTVTNADHMAVVSSGAAINSSGQLYSNKSIVYRPGQGVVLRFTAVFSSGVAGNIQLIGAYDEYDGLGFGYNETVFSLFRRKGGVTEWIPQTSWNVDTLNGGGPSGANINFGTGYGNVFQIQYQYLGFGALKYKVENPFTGKFTTVHIIRYANTETVPSFHIPSFPLRFESTNTTNNTNIVIKSASMMAGIEGKIVYLGPRFNSNWIGATVNRNVDTIIAAWEVKTTFHGHNSKVITYATQLSLATGTTDKPQILKIWTNATFTAPVWTDIDTNQSVVQRLSNLDAWNGDGTIINLLVAPGRGDFFLMEMTPGLNSITSGPGFNIVLTLQGIGGSGTTTGSLSWLEDQ